MKNLEPRKNLNHNIYSPSFNGGHISCNILDVVSILLLSLCKQGLLLQHDCPSVPHIWGRMKCHYLGLQTDLPLTWDCSMNSFCKTTVSLHGDLQNAFKAPLLLLIRNKILTALLLVPINQFTIVGGSEAGVDLVLIQPFLLSYIDHVVLKQTTLL